MEIHAYEKQPATELRTWKQLPYEGFNKIESLYLPVHFGFRFCNLVSGKDTIDKLDTPEHIDSGGAPIWDIPCSPSADSFGLVHSPGDASSTDDANYGLADGNDDESEAEVIYEDAIRTDDGESEEMPASMESWAYQMSSCSSSGSEYEYGFLPGMQKTMNCRRAISSAIGLAADDDENNILMPDEDLSGNGGELSSWGCPAYGKFPSKSTSPIGFPEKPSCVPFGTLHPLKHRGVSSVAVPFQPISQQHQQQSQQKQQTRIPRSPVHTYRHQQAECGCYQYQPPAQPDAHPAGWISIDNTIAAAGSSVAHPHHAPLEDLGLWLVQYPNSPSGLTYSTPSSPLERRGGRPIPPSEMDLRWNIWTVGNLAIRCTASGVGVKHLKQVLYRDDNYTGYRRSKWTHKRLSAEVVVRRANQEATNRVVGRPKGFLAHQGWWFYIGAS